MEDRATHGAFVPVVAAGKPPVRQMESPVSFKHGYMDAWSKQKLKTLFERSTKSTSAYQQHAPVQKAEPLQKCRAPPSCRSRPGLRASNEAPPPEDGIKGSPPKA